ncbi:MAG: FAD-dependent oxidoreductase [Clostridia bacterium]|nr:FAD-dependent oxidoreductase [Clostridia bacterium]
MKDTETVEFSRKLTVKKSYDVIVAGGGVAGAAAAVSAAKRGRSVLLLEKSNILGGLATLGLINLFVPMCNGHGKQIIFGFAEKWLRASALYGYDTIPEPWKDGEPKAPTDVRYMQQYSPYIFALQMTEEVTNAGVDLLFDCIASYPVMEGGHCKGIITDSKSGLEYYACKMLIDTTGDADLLRRSGIPTVNGENFFTYSAKTITLEGCRRAAETGNIRMAYGGVSGGTINLYGDNQPADVPRWSGTTVDEVSDYLIRNQKLMLDNLKKQPRLGRDIANFPLMPQFRTTCRIDGDYTLHVSDCYKHFDDSVCAINDFDHRNHLFEVPLRTLTRRGFDNIMTAGRSASGAGYGWDLLRVIPPAILTGQAAGEACVLALESGCAVHDVSVPKLQNRLEAANVMIHFPDSYIPEDRTVIIHGNLDGHLPEHN